MATNTSKIVVRRWPSQLGHVLRELQTGTHQETSETPMADGSKKKQDIGSPIAVLAATVSLTEADYDALMAFFREPVRGPFSFIDPVAETEKFAAFFDEPFSEGLTLTAGEKERQVRIVLRDMTGQIETAKSAGVEIVFGD